jgi:hypothetical protein
MDGRVERLGTRGRAGRSAPVLSDSSGKGRLRLIPVAELERCLNVRIGGHGGKRGCAPGNRRFAGETSTLRHVPPLASRALAQSGGLGGPDKSRRPMHAKAGNCGAFRCLRAPVAVSRLRPIRASVGWAERHGEQMTKASALTCG